jgi:hypothetical protein
MDPASSQNGGGAAKVRQASMKRNTNVILTIPNFAQKIQVA